MAQQTQLNLSLLAFDSMAEHDYTISILPGTLKVQWTFGIDETTKKLIVKDYKMSTEPLQKGTSLDNALQDLENFYKFKLNINSIINKDENVDWDDYISKFLFIKFNEFLAQYESVEQFTEKLVLQDLDKFDKKLRDDKNCVNLLLMMFEF